MAVPVQLKVTPKGRGFVELAFTQGDETMAADDSASVLLQYPQSGAIIGGPSTDEEIAELLIRAAENFNDELRRICT